MNKCFDRIARFKGTADKFNQEPEAIETEHMHGLWIRV